MQQVLILLAVRNQAAAQCAEESARVVAAKVAALALRPQIAAARVYAPATGQEAMHLSPVPAIATVANVPVAPATVVPLISHRDLSNALVPGPVPGRVPEHVGLPAPAPELWRVSLPLPVPAAVAFAPFVPYPSACRPPRRVPASPDCQSADRSS